MIDRGRGVAVCNNGYYMYTADEGRSWTTYRLGNNNLERVIVAHDGSLIVVADKRQIYRSTRITSYNVCYTKLLRSFVIVRSRMMVSVFVFLSGRALEKSRNGTGRILDDAEASAGTEVANRRQDFSPVFHAGRCAGLEVFDLV